MKNVLVVSYHVPPRASVASLRARGLARYLGEFGWHPVFLTPTLPGEPPPYIDALETPYPGNVTSLVKRKLGLNPSRGLQEQLGVPALVRDDRSSATTRTIRALKSWIAYPDDQRLWISHGARAALEALGRERFAAIASSSPPVSAHIIASKIARVTGIPWVADFRDLWTQNPYYRADPLRRFLEERLERRTLEPARALCTISEVLAEELASRYRRKPVHVVHNGFDPTELGDGIPDPSRFTLVHAGQLYLGLRDPSPLLRAVSELLSEGTIDPRRCRIVFYGPRVHPIEQLVEDLGLRDVVTFEGTRPRDEVLKAQRSAQVLVLIRWDDPREAGSYSGKIFEYLAARRPILSLGGPPGVVGKLLAETGAGVHLGGVKEIQGWLREAYREFEATGAVSYRGVHEKIMRYSHREMARRFAAILDEVASES